MFRLSFGYLLFGLLLTACGSSVPGGGGNTGSTLGSDGAGTLTGAVTGTVSHATVYLNSNNTGAPNISVAILQISANYTPSDSSSVNQIALTSPTGVTDANLASGVSFPALPGANTTLTNTTAGVCGSIALNVFVPTGVLAYNYFAATDCSGNAQTPTGSFTFNVTSTPTLVGGAPGTVVGVDYGFTGSLTAVLGATSGPSTTLSLTF